MEEREKENRRQALADVVRAFESETAQLRQSCLQHKALLKQAELSLRESSQELSALTEKANFEKDRADKAETELQVMKELLAESEERENTWREKYDAVKKNWARMSEDLFK